LIPDKSLRCNVRKLRKVGSVRFGGSPVVSRPRRRAHALFPRPKGEAGEPYLPKLGELYLVETRIFSFGTDPAADRPAVVIGLPPGPESKSPIQVVTRTSQSVPGVKHPADLSLRLDKDGVFADLTSIEQQLWRPENVLLLGVLPDPYVSLVLERFS
jgi:hypothetical protein